MRKLMAVACALAVAVAGCASDDDDDASATTVTASSTSPPPPTTIPTSDTQAPPAVTPPVTNAPDTTTPETDPPDTAAPVTSDDQTPPTEATDAPVEGIRTVPADYPSIQAAVDAAEPGDLILISPGVYEEAVDVTTDDLTIRGLDRNTVILDGGFELVNGIRVIGANGVAVENMTARNFTRNGFFFTEVDRYHGSYLTAYRNGDYGIYAYDATNGVFEHSYASGSPDAGFYIGECFPCDAVIDDVLSEYNGLGYSGTNAGGNLAIINSTFRYNRAGIVPNSGSYEGCYPQRLAQIVGNLVYSNNQPDTPAIDVAVLAMGNGILSAGGTYNLIMRNRVYDHDKTGIGLVPYPEDDPVDVPPPEEEVDRPCEETEDDPPPDPATLPDSILWDSKHNIVVENVLEDNRDGDLVVASVGTDVSSLENCWDQNIYTTTYPTNIEQLAPCGGVGSGDWTAGAYNVAAWLNEEHPPSADYKTATPVPPDQPNMPDAETAPARPAEVVPPMVSFDTVHVPAKPTA